MSTSGPSRADRKWRESLRPGDWGPDDSSALDAEIRASRQRARELASDKDADLAAARKAILAYRLKTPASRKPQVMPQGTGESWKG